MRQDKKALVDEWLARVKDDELNVKSILKHRDGTPAMVCFICHQIVEKIFKGALLFFSGDYPKEHSLSLLAKLLRPYDKSISEELNDDIVLLNPYYIEARYPADISLEEFTWEMAEEA